MKIFLIPAILCMLKINAPNENASATAAASSNAKNNNENSQFSNIEQEPYALDELKKIAAKGAVIQYALPAHLIYDTIDLDAFLS